MNKGTGKLSGVLSMISAAFAAVMRLGRLRVGVAEKGGTPAKQRMNQGRSVYKKKRGPGRVIPRNVRPGITRTVYNKEWIGKRRVKA